MTLKQFLDAFTPRFVTDEVAFSMDEQGYHLIGSMWMLDPGERYDATGKIRSFNLFGWAIFPKLIGDIDRAPGYVR